LDKAQQALAAQVQEDFSAKSSEKQNSDLIYISDSGESGATAVKTTAKADDMADRFDMTVTLKKSVQTVKKSDLEALLAEGIKGVNNFQNAQPVEGSLNYQVGDITNKDKQVTMNVAATESFTFQLNQDQIKRDISGKDRAQLNAYFSTLSGIRQASVNFWPFYVSKVPNSFDKIRITLDIGDSV
jgi:hypothetical protein